MVKLKSLVEQILKEGRGTNHWVEPNGTAHQVDAPTHWHWADDYVRKMNWSVTEDPYKQLIDRGWIRVIYSYTESLIMVYHKGQLTRQQKEFLEDQAEETEWLVMDDDGRILYRPVDCITPDKDKDREDKLQEGALNYNFREFKELARGDGFGYPIDVSYGTVHIGTIVAEADGFVIQSLQMPKMKVNIVSVRDDSKKHVHYKTMEEAAKLLHRYWKYYRSHPGISERKR